MPDVVVRIGVYVRFVAVVRPSAVQTQEDGLVLRPVHYRLIPVPNSSVYSRISKVLEPVSGVAVRGRFRIVNFKMHVLRKLRFIDLMDAKVSRRHGLAKF